MAIIYIFLKKKKSQEVHMLPVKGPAATALVVILQNRLLLVIVLSLKIEVRSPV